MRFRLVITRVLPPLIALASLTLVVSLTLALVLVSGDGGDAGPAPPDAGAAAAPDTPSMAAPAETPPPAPTPTVPPELSVRLNNLPQKLRDEALLAYGSGSLGREQLELIVTRYENRNPSLRVGSVIQASGGVLRFEVFTTGEQASVTTGEQTLVRRGDGDIALEDLEPGELVMVVTSDGGGLALTIEALGVPAP